MMWRTARTLVLDTETTGISFEEDRVVEIGGYSFEAGDVSSGTRMSTLLNPGVPIPKAASAVHGISDADVADAPNFASVAWRIIERVNAAEVLAGYNWPFDAQMLEAEFRRDAEAREALDEDNAWRFFDAWQRALKSKPVLDPLVVVRFDSVGRYWKGKGRHKLDAVASRLHIERVGDSHRASSDAALAARVLHALAGHMPADAWDADNLIRQEREQQDARFNAWKAAQEKTDGK